MSSPRRLGVLLLIITAWLSLPGQGGAQPPGLSVGSLTCEYLKDPAVVDVPHPRLSWVNTASPGARGQAQTAYQIQVASSERKLLGGEADLWDSGRIDSDQSVRVSYAGKALVSRQDCWWRVRVWDRKSNVSLWSSPGFWSMGLLDPSEWQADWIGAPWQGEEPLPDPPRRASQSEGVRQPEPPREMPPPAPMLRKTFLIDKDIVSARAYVTGLGFFELYVNGEKVSGDVLVPNLTLFGKRPGLGDNMIALADSFREYRVMYLAYDLTNLLSRGENVVGAILGNGFYNAPSRWTESYGTPRFLGQIYVTYADGSEQVVLSDESWKAARSPIVMDLIYDGEDYDARLEQPGWSAPGFDDSGWEPVALRKAPEGRMKAHMSPTDRVMESLEPVSIERLGDGHYKVDFGEEISGWLRLSGLQGEAGHRIDITYVSESHVGDNSYTLKGEGLESYATRFSWYVFREVEITNWPGELRADQLRAEAVYSNVRSTGEFESSNPLLNTIHRIWRRSQTDNMHGGIVSDCPHRERSPYTGDGQVACVTVMHNYDVGAFYTKWIQDIVGSQDVYTGYVPNCAPWQPGCGGGVAWGAAMNIMPWEFYLHYGDLDMLEDTLEGMKDYVRYMLTWTDGRGVMRHQRLGNDGQPLRWFNLGDWAPAKELPPDHMVHTFYLWRSADLTARTAEVLGKTSEAEEYYELAERTRRAFQQGFFDEEDGTYGAYGGNVFALRMGVPEDQNARVISALRRDIEANEGHLDTGIFGTQFFFEVLSENGMHDLAYEAMTKRTFPSYGWWIEQGATTTWEQWSGRGSHNHPMFGGGIVWLYRKLAGMNADPEQPGYRHIVFRPEPVADVAFARYSNETPFGTAGILWEEEDARFSMDIQVPVGSTATVFVPTEAPADVTESGHPIVNGPNLSFEGVQDGYAVYSVASGEYHFVTPRRRQFLAHEVGSTPPATGSETFTVTLEEPENGQISVAPPLPKDGRVPAGTLLTVTVRPDEGYALDSGYYAVPGRFGRMYHESPTTTFEVVVDQDKAVGASFIEQEALGGFTVRQDVVYAQPGTKPLKYDVYTPDGAKDLPLVVIVHGGGWRANDEDIMRGLARVIVRTGDYVVASVDYRWLADGDGDEVPNSMADLINDVFGAIAHIQEHAAEYGADPARIAVTGDSAGGHLSAAAANMAGMIGEGGFGKTPGVYEYLPTYLPATRSVDEVRNEIAAAIQVAAPSYGVFGTGMLSGVMERMGGGAVPRETLAAFSPIEHVPSPEERTVPQLLLRGTEDRLITDEEVQAYADALEAAGQKVVYRQVEGAGHAFFDWKPDAETRATFAKYGVSNAETMKAFFDGVFYADRGRDEE